MLPGSYAFTTASATMTYGQKNVVLVKDPNDYANVLDCGSRSASRVEEGGDLAKKSYDACLRTKMPRPKNCPFRWTNTDHRYRNGSVTWRQIGADPFRKPTVQLSPGRPRWRSRCGCGCPAPARSSGDLGTCRQRHRDRRGLDPAGPEKLSVVWLT